MRKDNGERRAEKRGRGQDDWNRENEEEEESEGVGRGEEGREGKEASSARPISVHILPQRAPYPDQ